MRNIDFYSAAVIRVIILNNNTQIITIKLLLVFLSRMRGFYTITIFDHAILPSSLI